MAFDLSDLLKGVSDSDTGREQIEYIGLELIDGDAGNFYEISEIEKLANNIATVGLQQPLRLRPHPEAEGRYMIVSGHRRKAALNLLVQEDPERWKEVACIVQRDSVSPAMQQLRLIFANSDTRKMSSADQNEQAAQVEKLLYQLKEEGYEFPGRMRDYVAEVVQLSKTKLARLKMIRENLAECWQPRYKKNKLAESVAYSLAQLPDPWQRVIYAVTGENGYICDSYIKRWQERLSKLDNLSCKRRGRKVPCQNVAKKQLKAVEVGIYQTFHCNKCCSDCPELVSCKYACPVMADKIKQLKADKKEARRQVKTAQEEKDRPQIEKIKALWLRYGCERERAGKSVQEVYDAMDMYYRRDDGKKVEALEGGWSKVSPNTKLPFNYSCYLSDVNRLIALADLFGCSIDYLFCRTDVREVAQAAPETVENVSNSDTGWNTGDPTEEGTYVVLTQFDEDCSPIPEKLTWNGAEWQSGIYTFDPECDGKIIGWMKYPEVSEC